VPKTRTCLAAKVIKMPMSLDRKTKTRRKPFLTSFVSQGSIWIGPEVQLGSKILDIA